MTDTKASEIMLTKEEYTELFTIQVRGAIATAFIYGNIPPENYWPMVNGEQELTMRAVGEIGYLTGYNMHMQLSPRLERSSDQPNKAPEPHND